jgi:maltose alpha-D-glucosyltransferase/alpha-amylase
MVLVQGFIRNQGDGWGWTLDYLSRVLNSAAVVDPEAQVEDIADALAGYGNFAAAIGKRLGELHAILAAPTDNPDFAPAKATVADGAGWAAAVRAQLEAALAALGAVPDWPDDESRRAAALVKARRAALNKAVDWLAKAASGTLKTRTHGDFHLGQVLVSSGDAYIIDFEGEPARPLGERRAKSSPLRDVAGLLRSFDYAVAAASSRAEGPAQNAPRKATVLEEFAANASKAFLAAYREVHAESPRPWVTEAGEPALLDLFLIEKAAYEICYEAANRPGWIGIPLHGLARIVARITAPVMEAADG